VTYDDYIMVWKDALAKSGLSVGGFVTEAIVLRDMTRKYRAYASLRRLPPPDGFNVTAELSWNWDALLSARSATVEEDMLMQVLGDDRRDVPTVPPFLRVDIVLHATRPWGKPEPMPTAPMWKRWVALTQSRLAPLLLRDVDDNDGNLAVMAWRGEPEAKFVCQSDGQLALVAVEVSAWEGMMLPRQWDDPARGYDEEPDEHLTAFFGRVAQALQVWEESVLLLQRDGR
jgi:hypothetical protein